MTNEYQRGYAKGVSGSSRRTEERVAVYQKALAEMMKRAERAEAKIGLGPCQLCSHWRRERSAFWGYCTLTEKIFGPDWPWRGDPEQRIATKENFGCIRFAPLGDRP